MMVFVIDDPSLKHWNLLILILLQQIEILKRPVYMGFSWITNIGSLLFCEGFLLCNSEPADQNTIIVANLGVKNDLKIIQLFGISITLQRTNISP